MARKSASFAQLLRYLNRSEEPLPPFLRNFNPSTSYNQTEVLGQFLANARCLPPRKRGNILYHEVMSFSKASIPFLTVPIIRDLMDYYLELRAPYALAYGKVHTQSACTHIHLIISANNVDSDRRLRVSQADFRRIKKELERYQRERYPMLDHSVAQEKANCKRTAPTMEANPIEINDQVVMGGELPRSTLLERQRRIQGVELKRMARMMRERRYRECLRVLLSFPCTIGAWEEKRWKAIVRALSAGCRQNEKEPVVSRFHVL